MNRISSSTAVEVHSHRALEQKNILYLIFKCLDVQEMSAAAPTNRLWNRVSNHTRLPKLPMLHQLDTWKAILSSKPKERVLPDSTILFGTSEYIAWIDNDDKIHFCNIATMEDDPEVLDSSDRTILTYCDDILTLFDSDDHNSIYVFDKQKKKFVHEIDVSPIWQNLRDKFPEEQRDISDALGTEINGPILFVTKAGYYFTWDSVRGLSEPKYGFPAQFEGQKFTFYQSHKNEDILCLIGRCKTQIIVSYVNIRLGNAKLLLHYPSNFRTTFFDADQPILCIQESRRILSFKMEESGLKELSSLDISQLAEFDTTGIHYPYFNGVFEANRYGVSFRFGFASFSGEELSERQIGIWNPRHNKIRCIKARSIRINEDLIIDHSGNEIRCFHKPTGGELPSVSRDNIKSLSQVYTSGDNPNSIAFLGTNDQGDTFLTVFTKPDNFQPVARPPKVEHHLQRNPVQGVTSASALSQSVLAPSLGSRIVTWLHASCFYLLLQRIGRVACCIFCCSRRAS